MTTNDGTNIEIPFDIVEKAREVQLWFIKNGHSTWQLCDICSRDHAFVIARIKKELSKLDAF